MYPGGSQEGRDGKPLPSPPTRDGLLQTPKDFQFLLVRRLREPERERAPLTPGWTAAPLTKALLTFENPSEGPELPGAGSEG